MFNIFKKKTIIDNAKDFEKQYKAAKIIIFKYLEVWFKQIFETPEYKAIFGNGDLYVTLAAQVENYLFGEDLDEVVKRVDNKVKDQILQIKKHVPKWADDAMNRDKDFSEFVIQTIRMDMIFHQYLDGEKWLFEDPRGKRVSEVLMKYGGNVTENPDPKKYDKLLRKWIMWSDISDKKIKEGA